MLPSLKHGLPDTVQVLPNMTREVAKAGGTTLNLCSQDVLLEVLRFLKRAYWPFAWDSTAGPSSGRSLCPTIRPILHVFYLICK